MSLFGQRSSRAACVALSDEQEMDLVQGERGAFASEAARRAAWRAHRERLMASVNPCTRPAAWWDYEAKAPRDPHRSADEQLYVLGALSPAGREQFEAWCARTKRDLETIPPVGYRVTDPYEPLR